MDEKSAQVQGSNGLNQFLGRPPSLLQFFARLPKWFVSHRLEVLLTVLLIVLLTTGAFVALFGTDQGRDLLQLALDQKSALTLFSGLSVAMILVVFLLRTVAKGAPKSDPGTIIYVTAFGKLVAKGAPKSDPGTAHRDDLEEWFVLLILTAFGMAIVAGWYGKSVWLGIEVYFTGGMIGAVVVALVVQFFERSPMCAGYIFLCFSIVCLLAVAYSPTEIGATFGSPLLLTVLLILWILFVFALAAIGFLSGRPGYGIKGAFFGVMVWLVVKLLGIDPFSLGYLDRDYVRQQDGPRSDTLPTLKAAYLAWRKKQTEPVPQLVLVAAAGGGIRASYWTSLVLTRLADRGTDLRGKLFAASGVSGGSLGLGVSYGLLSAPAFTCAAAGDIREPCVKLFHRQDFLVGPLGATLAGYPANIFVPFFPRRNYALEIGWERAWQDTVGHQSPVARAFSAPMTALWPEDGRNRPLLLLNATSARSGERVMSADVRTDWIYLQTPCRLNLAEEINLSLSAAIGASARFPIVSDWGWLWRPKSPGCGRLEGVADGGFYDNYGAATILDLLNGLASQNGGSVNLQRDVNLVVIQITSDPTRQMGCIFKKLDAESMSHDDTRSTDDYCSPPPQQTAFQNAAFNRLDEILQRELGLDVKLPRLSLEIEAFQTSFLGSGEPGVIDVETQARAVNGIKVAEMLRERTCALGGSYYHFAMTGAEAIPLNWTLSPTSQTRLSALLDRGRGKDRLDRLVTELRTGVGLGQCYTLARARK